ncbi:uncharacterized protein LOC141731015 [Zonotrichia albicollis]|uniref:uncharacterized protein LOC141731015 n=1 Tax=Zonotrichia albicollis TaxID=44394 RepID=UPI003D80B6EC
MRAPGLEPEPGDGALPSAAPGASCGTAQADQPLGQGDQPLGQGDQPLGQGHQPLLPPAGGVRGWPRWPGAPAPRSQGGENGVVRAPTAAALELLPVRQKGGKGWEKGGLLRAEPPLPSPSACAGGQRGAAVPPALGPALPPRGLHPLAGHGGRDRRGRRSPWTCRGFARPRLLEACHKGQGCTDSPRADAWQGVSNAERPMEGF